VSGDGVEKCILLNDYTVILKNTHMNISSEPTVAKDLANKKITITKNFNAPTTTVWEAWTTKETLDQWWAPKPWRAETESLEFKPGGLWLYAMVGPENERHNARVEYTKIENGKSFSGIDSFADGEGNIMQDLPSTQWNVDFQKAGTGTTLVVTLTAETREALDKLLEMGFEEGFKMGLNNLEEYLESHT
jgi:uncharacterized protein YndB with AHSA1/START domain